MSVDKQIIHESGTYAELSLVGGAKELQNLQIGLSSDRLRNHHVVGGVMYEGLATISSSGLSGDGMIPFVGADSYSMTGDTNNFYWDRSNARLGIGTNTPAKNIESAVDDLIDSAVTDVARFSHTASGGAASNDMGVGIELVCEDAYGTDSVQARIMGVVASTGGDNILKLWGGVDGNGTAKDNSIIHLNATALAVTNTNIFQWGGAPSYGWSSSNTILSQYTTHFGMYGYGSEDSFGLFSNAYPSGATSTTMNASTQGAMAGLVFRHISTSEEYLSVYTASDVAAGATFTETEVMRFYYSQIVSKNVVMIPDDIQLHFGDDLAGNSTYIYYDEAGSDRTTIDGANLLLKPGCDFYQGYKSTDPTPPTNEWCMWMAEGTGTGDAGDIIVSINSASVTKTTTLIDFSALP